MRSVMSATWTSVRPVSPSAWPNFWTSSCFRSWVSVIRRARVAGPGFGPLLLRAQLADPFHVLLHLGHQRGHGVKPPLAPQAGQEVQPDGLAVEVHISIQHVG